MPKDDRQIRHAGYRLVDPVLVLWVQGAEVAGDGDGIDVTFDLIDLVQDAW